MGFRLHSWRCTEDEPLPRLVDAGGRFGTGACRSRDLQRGGAREKKLPRPGDSCLCRSLYRDSSVSDAQLVGGRRIADGHARCRIGDRPVRIMLFRPRAVTSTWASVILIMTVARSHGNVSRSQVDVTALDCANGGACACITWNLRAHRAVANAASIGTCPFNRAVPVDLHFSSAVGLGKSGGYRTQRSNQAGHDWKDKAYVSYGYHVSCDGAWPRALDRGS